MKKQSIKYARVLLVLCFLFGYSCNTKQDKEEEPLYIDSPIDREKYFYDVRNVTDEYFATNKSNSIYLYRYSINS